MSVKRKEWFLKQENSFETKKVIVEKIITPPKKKHAFTSFKVSPRFKLIVFFFFFFVAGGVVLGSVFTLLFFQRRKWPIFAGAGFGVGMAYANCEREMNNILKR